MVNCEYCEAPIQPGDSCWRSPDGQEYYCNSDCFAFHHEMQHVENYDPDETESNEYPCGCVTHPGHIILCENHEADFIQHLEDAQEFYTQELSQEVQDKIEKAKKEGSPIEKCSYCGMNTLIVESEGMGLCGNPEKHYTIGSCANPNCPGGKK